MSLGRRAHPPRAVLFVFSLCSQALLHSLSHEGTPGGAERFFPAHACSNPRGTERVGEVPPAHQEPPVLRIPARLSCGSALRRLNLGKERQGKL